ncbi:hypothetical protein GGI12_005269 [Dipsacomyces acuminosporus]|nr:hypothetical protein GGI12_005269 [Dipsacomyces acuminosporus]
MLERETWKHTGLDKLLFTCECMLYSMSQTAGKHQELIPISQLAKRLHSLEREFKRRALLHVASNNDRQAGLLRGAGTSTGPLRNFLWAVLFASKIPQQKKIDIIRGEVEHIQRLIPGVALSVADLEPALLAALPAALWRTARRGNFKDDSAFIPADEFICNFGRTSIHPYIERILDMAKAAELSQSSDHRLFPIRAWIAVLEGNLQRAMSVFKKSLEVAHLRVVPGSLAVANTRDHSFFEQMLCVASTFRRGADFATTHMRSAMRSQETSTPLTPRIATGLLYCCDTSRNFAVARDTIESLEALETHEISPKVSELYMRVCIACGEMAKALAIFDQLNYSSKHTQSGEPSFLHIIDYMGNSRLSAAGAEYAFATWLSIMDYQGRISPALMEQWQKAGLSRDARGKRNMFLPESGLSVDQALQSVGIERRKPGSLSDRQFLRDWEYTMVMSLVGAYISAGYTERALVWEQWILHAIGNKQIRLSPALLNRTAHVQLKHISRGDWEGMRMCLDYVIAIDSSLGIGIFRKDTYYLNQAPVFKSVALAMSRDAASSGQLAAQIKSYLAERDAAYILDKIYKLI